MKKIYLILGFILVATTTTYASLPSDQLGFVRNDLRLSAREIATLKNKSMTRYFEKLHDLFPKSESITFHSQGPVRKPTTLPEGLLESGRQLRELKDIALLNPNQTANVLEFFNRCIHDHDLLSTINALCLGHTWDISSKLSLPFDEQNYPSQMVELARIAIIPQ